MEVHDPTHGLLIFRVPAKQLGLTTNQFNFLFGQFFNILLGGIMRRYLPASKTSVLLRHWYEIVFGLCILLLCIGPDTIHVMLQASVGYLLIRVIPQRYSPYIVAIWSMGYLCWCHIRRQFFVTLSPAFDLSGPMMMETERLTSLAFNVFDGSQLEENDKMDPNMRKHAVRKVPNLLEFFSYSLSFHTVLCGPFVFYNDYIAFIKGFSLKDYRSVVQIPSGHRPLIELVVQGILYLTAFQIISPFFAVEKINTAAYLEWNFLYKTFFYIMCFSLFRTKYYGAWSIAEASNVSAGLSYIGINEEGREDWSLMNNVIVRKVELATSLKQMIDNWHITSGHWLRELVYLRLSPQFRTLGVFVFSAVWHGFYPGYYLCTVLFAVFLMIARQVRRQWRPLFQASNSTRVVYDIATWFVSVFFMNFAMGPFVLLYLEPSLSFWHDLYYYPIVFGGVVMLVLYFTRKS